LDIGLIVETACHILVNGQKHVFADMPYKLEVDLFSGAHNGLNCNITP
jgi:CYTH domain-containing protein